jgi:hypothetical protein
MTTQTKVGELTERGHFVLSPDRKLFAYVETKIPGGEKETAEIRMCDATTRKQLAVAKIQAPVGPLKFFDEGVAAQERDGKLKLRISLSKDHDTEGVLETNDRGKNDPSKGGTRR